MTIDTKRQLTPVRNAADDSEIVSHESQTTLIELTHLQQRTSLFSDGFSFMFFLLFHFQTEREEVKNVQVTRRVGHIRP